VAGIVGADLADVLVAGYSNGYIHYVTTPEEYEDQQYEGGSTLFGRWELPALQQTVATLATAMRDGRPVDPGLPTKDLSARHAKKRPKVITDALAPRSSFGQVVVDALAQYRACQRVVVAFVGAHPGHDLHRGGTYLRVERADGPAWRTVQDDGDWATRFVWTRGRQGRSEVSVTWDIPADVEPGRYRISYLGDAQVEGEPLRPFTGTCREFDVVA
jgi:neutral ceramidase